MRQVLEVDIEITERNSGSQGSDWESGEGNMHTDHLSLSPLERSRLIRFWRAFQTHMVQHGVTLKMSMHMFDWCVFRDDVLCRTMPSDAVVALNTIAQDRVFTHKAFPRSMLRALKRTLDREIFRSNSYICRTDMHHKISQWVLGVVDGISRGVRCSDIMMQETGQRVATSRCCDASGEHSTESTSRSHRTTFSKQVVVIVGPELCASQCKQNGEMCSCMCLVQSALSLCHAYDHLNLICQTCAPSVEASSLSTGGTVHRRFSSSVNYIHSMSSICTVPSRVVCPYDNEILGDKDCFSSPRTTISCSSQVLKEAWKTNVLALSRESSPLFSVRIVDPGPVNSDRCTTSSQATRSSTTSQPNLLSETYTKVFPHILSLLNSPEPNKNEFTNRFAKDKCAKETRRTINSLYNSSSGTLPLVVTTHSGSIPLAEDILRNASAHRVDLAVLCLPHFTKEKFYQSKRTFVVGIPTNSGELCHAFKYARSLAKQGDNLVLIHVGLLESQTEKKVNHSHVYDFCKTYRDQGYDMKSIYADRESVVSEFVKESLAYSPDFLIIGEMPVSCTLGRSLGIDERSIDSDRTSCEFRESSDREMTGHSITTSHSISCKEFALAAIASGISTIILT
eukprot:CAMPEP_0185035874 /NCGR_PEP_ID=MMETSP1103-20130426/27950_1 /TAXON_ID=36769 /ORGANISM="Paraphysomonas bandaiensis, Strain Caron Lab Isolate" /LENGTH=622 /DNA_ID=CAMNT_0027573151 /DNA_START=297 /DNA_END=2165 /DNA_ORIENTATION=-